MHAVQTQHLDLVPAHYRHDEGNVVRAAWPVHRATGARSTAAVLFELDRGMRLGRHTDSAEEVLAIGAGDGTARVTGVFSANTIVSAFDDEWVPYDTRVLGTPPPAEALAAA